MARTRYEKVCRACGVVFMGRKHAVCCSHGCNGAKGTVEQRFWTKVNKGGPTLDPELGPCWVWTANVDPKGYGILNSGTTPVKMLKAHRISWELAQGAIPDGAFVCHRCDNRLCCNPGHLWLGNNLSNMADMSRKVRQPNRKLCPCSVRAIRRLSADEDLGTTELGKRFGVSATAVGYVLSGVTWRQVA